ncbi:UV radiation resistance-associated gene protein [Euwallacea similis]|uniref:UV radiation resistance-associated gene protein n=1 Tax=Euwallacea similis TaxID=1736056 RepID=UPI00344BC976
MDKPSEFADSMNFTAAEFALGRQRCRKWACLITQQLRLRHIYQIFTYNISEDHKAFYYFTLHNTPMSSPFYTSEPVQGQHPKWGELRFNPFIQTNLSGIVLRVWKATKNGDQIILTWGVNFSGLVYLGNKITVLQPKYFKANTVIFFMQGAYFTSQDYVQMDLEKPLPFQKNLNLIETARNEQVLYRRVAVKAPKGEVAISYTLEKLRRLQELQRKINSKKEDVKNVKEKIKKSSEREQELDHSQVLSSSIRYAPQLLTMNSLNKMLHEKPTKLEREQMTEFSRKIETCRFRLRLLYEEKDKMSANFRRLKQIEVKLVEDNEEKNSNLMSLYHILSKESHQWDEYKRNTSQLKEYSLLVSEQLWLRQHDLLKELLFIYPIDKQINENKYTMLGIHLPDSELLLDCQDAGVSVVLGYVCHVLVMCSMILQVPLRHPMRHFGSRSLIYDQVYPDVPDKEREFPLYTKGRDRAHFSYAVFLLNKNISQLRWYLHHKLTVDLKETLKHLRSFLLGDDLTDKLRYASHLKTDRSFTSADVTSGTLTGDSAVSLDRLVSPSSVSSLSSSNLNDPLLDKIQEEIRRERLVPERSSGAQPKKSFNIFKLSPKRGRKERNTKGSSEVLAVPEAYLNRQISQDLFHRCASGGYRFDDKGSVLFNVFMPSVIKEEKSIRIGLGIEEIKSIHVSYIHSDSIEEGTDPLDPSSNLDALAPSRSININRDAIPSSSCPRISRSVDSCVDDDSYRDLASCDRNSTSDISFRDVPVSLGEPRLLEQWLSGDSALFASGDSKECLRVSLRDVSSPLTERTNRLLSSNQSFNLVRHRPLD